MLFSLLTIMGTGSAIDSSFRGLEDAIALTLAWVQATGVMLVIVWLSRSK